MIDLRVDGRDVTVWALLLLVAVLITCNDRPQDAAARPVPDANADDDKVTHVDFGNGERKAKGA